MKKVCLFLTLAFMTLLACSTQCWCKTQNATFDELLKSQEAKERVLQIGKPHYLSLADSVGEKRLKVLVPQFLSEKDSTKKLALACAIMTQVFPNGDPKNWEAVDGYLPNNTRLPMQLCALDAFMNAVVILVEQGSEESFATARYLVERLGSSSTGKFYFITETPLEFRRALDKLIEATHMVAGIWTSDHVTGHLPLTPRYWGCVSYDYAIQENMQFFNGMLQLAGNGEYAWNRKTGAFYIIEFPFGFRSWGK